MKKFLLMFLFTYAGITFTNDTTFTNNTRQKLYSFSAIGAGAGYYLTQNLGNIIGNIMFGFHTFDKPLCTRLKMMAPFALARLSFVIFLSAIGHTIDSNLSELMNKRSH